MDIILSLIVFIIIIRIVPMIIGGAIGIVLGLLRAFFENLDLIIPAVLLYLPLKILQFTNYLQYLLQKPWRCFLKNPGNLMFWIYKYKIHWIAEIVLYVLLTPLRAFNAFCYNMIVRNLFMFFDVLQEILHPQLNEMRYHEGWNYFWRWLVFLPVRIVVYGIKFIFSLWETALFTCLEIVLPTLTLYHGTSHNASTSIARPNEWLVGGGAYAGYGIYFAPRKSTARHYSSGVIVVSRVTLGRIENLNLHPYICSNWVAKRGHSITQWALDEGITTVEWWRTTGDYRWWEYCMVDHDAGYDNPWRIRPLYREDACTGKYERTWGGVGLWTFAILENLN